MCQGHQLVSLLAGPGSSSSQARPGPGFPGPSRCAHRVTQVARFKFVPIAVFVFATLITGGARYRDLEVQSAAAAIAAERPRNLIELS